MGSESNFRPELRVILEVEDTSFVSIADFFSLLSIAFIYFAVSFGNPVSSAPTLKVDSSSESGAGPAMPMDSTVANVSILSADSEGIVVRVTSPSGAQRSDLYVRQVRNPLNSVPTWAADQLAAYKGVKYVVLYMSVSDVNVDSFRLRDRIGSVLSQKYDVRLVF